MAYRTFHCVNRGVKYSPNSMVRRLCHQAKKNSIDKEDVVFHSKLASKWWDLDGPMKALHAFNNIRVPFIRNGLVNAGVLDEKKTLNDPKYLEGFSFADIGCGGGILTIALARLGCKINGVEPSSELVEVGKCVAEKDGNVSANFVASSVEDYAKENPMSHDAVVCSEVIEHVTNKDMFVESCVSLIKPGGSIFFTTINKSIPAWFMSVVLGEYVLRIVPCGTHQYDKLISPSHLETILNKYNCSTHCISSHIYVPFKNEFYWNSSLPMFYSLHAVKSK